MNSTSDSTADGIAPQPDCQGRVCDARPDAGEAGLGASPSQERRVDPWDQWKSARDLH